jgi:hypothetical protein
MSKKLLLISSLIIISLVKNSYANENGYSYKTGCRYNNYKPEDCIGKVGYIHITPWQEDQKKYKDLACKLSIFVDRSKINPDVTKLSKALPEVGSIVGPNARLIFYQDLEQIKRQYDHCDKSLAEIDKRVDYKKVGFKSAEESQICGISGCLALVNRYAEFINGEEDSFGAGNRLEILSYERLEQGLFAKVKVVPKNP